MSASLVPLHLFVTLPVRLSAYRAGLRTALTHTLDTHRTDISAGVALCGQGNLLVGVFSDREEAAPPTCFSVLDVGPSLRSL